MRGRRFRVYIMAYNPPGLDMKRAHATGQLERWMTEANLCFTVGRGGPWPIGRVLTPDVRHENGILGAPTLDLGRPYRCVAHEHHGKVAIVEPVEHA